MSENPVEVEAMDFEQAMSWLDERGIDFDDLESLEEMKTLIRVSIGKRVESFLIEEKTQSAQEAAKEREHSDMAVDGDEIETFDYSQSVDWLDDRGIDYEALESLDEMKSLIKANIQKSPKMAKDPKFKTPSQQPNLDTQKLMQEIVRQDKVMKRELMAVYNDLMKFLATHVNYEIKQVLRHHYGDFETTLDIHKKELADGDCAILVAGETSAGKSSLLNLILGEDVLPVYLLSATSTICRLRNSDRRAYTLVKANGEEETINIETEEDVETLKECVGSRQCRTGGQYRHVDIYWPIPMLQDCVTIVDSPGVGESEEMTEKLLKYLPHAVAFIYVINSSNAGGVQDDKLLSIIRAQQQWASGCNLSHFDTRSIVFVCNKWDKVEESGQEDAVWSTTLNKLRDVIPDVSETQVLRMSTTQAKRYQYNGMGTTPYFERLLRGINGMVPHSLRAKSMRHYRWLECFMKELQRVLVNRIHHAQSTTVEKDRLMATVSDRLKGLQRNSDQIRKDLTKKAERKCKSLARQLHIHLHSEEVVTRLTDWRDDDAPDADNDDLQVTKVHADKRIFTRVQDELMAWERDTDSVRKVAIDLTALFVNECKVLGELCDEVNLLIDGVDATDDIEAELGDVWVTSGDRTAIFSSSEKIIMAVAAPLWIPLFTVASAFFIPVGAGYLISEASRKSHRRKQYSQNKAIFMRVWSNEIIEAYFTKEKLEKFIMATNFERFRAKISTLCDDFIPKQIAADKSQIESIRNDQRTAVEIIDQYKPVHQLLKVVLGKLYLFDLRYMHTGSDNIGVRQLSRVRKIGKGSFSDVHLGRWKSQDFPERAELVAVKELRQSTKGANSYSQHHEIQCLRRLRHKNIVTFHGYTFSCLDGDDNLCSGNDPAVRGVEEVAVNTEMSGARRALDVADSSNVVLADTLSLVFELCDENLEEKIFKDKELVCRCVDANKDETGAFRFFVTMATGVCDGLSYIHDEGFIHRDLKLSNVLIKDGIAKICDMGFAGHALCLTGTFAGTVSHMSPEVLSNRPYSSATDLYSLAVLLWELWYGRHVYSEPEHDATCMPQIVHKVIAGERPSLTYEYQMPQELQDIVRQCWAHDPNKRPEAQDVGDKLRSLYKTDTGSTSDAR